MNVTGTILVNLEQHIDTKKWRACYGGHLTEYADTREKALELLRRMIAGGCYAAGVIAVEQVQLDLAEKEPVA
jgi:hypothetical protein